jgi:hypothetical protein
MKPLIITAKSALAGAVQRILADADTLPYPLEITLKPAERRMSDARRSELHCRIRDLARHAQAHNIPATEAGVKLQMKRGEIVGIEWPGKLRGGWNSEVWVPKDTEELTAKECADLIDQICAFGSEFGVVWTAPEHWTE